MTPRRRIGVRWRGWSLRRESSQLPIGRLGVIYDYQRHGNTLFFIAIQIRVKYCLQLSLYTYTASAGNKLSCLVLSKSSYLCNDKMNFSDLRTDLSHISYRPQEFLLKGTLYVMSSRTKYNTSLKQKREQLQKDAFSNFFLPIYHKCERLCYKTSYYKTPNYKTPNFKTSNCKTPNCKTPNYKTSNLTESRILQNAEIQNVKSYRTFKYKTPKSAGLDG